MTDLYPSDPPIRHLVAFKPIDEPIRAIIYDFIINDWVEIESVDHQPYDLIRWKPVKAIENLNRKYYVVPLDSYRLRLIGNESMCPPIDELKEEKQWREELYFKAKENKKTEHESDRALADILSQDGKSFSLGEVGWIKEDVVPGVMLFRHRRSPFFLGYIHFESQRIYEANTFTEKITDEQIAKEIESTRLYNQQKNKELDQAYLLAQTLPVYNIQTTHFSEFYWYDLDFKNLGIDIEPFDFGLASTEKCIDFTASFTNTPKEEMIKETENHFKYLLICKISDENKAFVCTQKITKFTKEQEKSTTLTQYIYHFGDYIKNIKINLKKPCSGVAHLRFKHSACSYSSARFGPDQQVITFPCFDKEHKILFDGVGSSPFEIFISIDAAAAAADDITEYIESIENQFVFSPSWYHDMQTLFFARGGMVAYHISELKIICFETLLLGGTRFERYETLGIKDDESNLYKPNDIGIRFADAESFKKHNNP